MTKQEIKVWMLNAGSLALIKNLKPNPENPKEIEKTLMLMQEIIKEEQQKLIEEQPK